ncbi:MAG: hypothetical protein D6753_16130, partial [Planctomycetota bacterium]
MLSLRLFLMVFVSFVCKEAMSAAPTLAWPSALAAVAGCVLGFGLLSKSAAIFLIKPYAAQVLAGHAAAHAPLYQFRQARRLIEWSWLVCLPPLLYASQWAQWSNRAIELGMPSAAAALMIVAPTLVLVVLLELSSAQLDHAVGGSEGGRSITQIWAQRLRLGDFIHLAAAVLPVLVITGSNDLLSRFWPQAPPAWIAAASVAIGISVVALGYPSFFARTSGGQAVDSGPLCQRIHQYARQLGLRRLP